MTTAGPKFPSTGANDASFGDHSWLNPTRVTAEDGSDASVSVSSFFSSNYLKATGFGFSVPSNAVIDGVQVEWKLKGIDSTAIVQRVALVVSGSVSGTAKTPGTSLTTTLTWYAYGGSSDVWGFSLTPTYVNATGFGFVLSLGASEGNTTPECDAARVTVYYHIPDVFGASSLSAGGSLTAAGSMVRGASSSLAGRAALTAVGGLVFAGGAALAATTSLSADVSLARGGAASLAATSALSAAPHSAIQLGAALLSGHATLTALGGSPRAGAAVLSGNATLASTAVSVRSGSATLTATANMALGALVMTTVRSLRPPPGQASGVQRIPPAGGAGGPEMVTPPGGASAVEATPPAGTAIRTRGAR